MALSETLTLTPTEAVTIRSSSEDALLVEATYAPGGSPPPKHLHPSQDEHFRILEGGLRVRVDGEQRDLSAGEELTVPRGAVHQMWNPGAAATRVEWCVSPPGRTEQWFRAVDALYSTGQVPPGKMPSPLDFAGLLREYEDVIRLAGPAPLIRPALSILAAVGRARR